MSSKGRAVPDQLSFVFPNGAEGIIHPLSQYTIANLEIATRKQYPPPAVPLAPGVGGEMQPNEADPDYEVAVQRYQVEHQARLMDRLFDVAVDIQVDDQELERLSRAMERVGAPIEELSDKVAYIKHCCLVNSKTFQHDMQALASLITGQAVPTEADVQAHVETFQGDVG